jgi:site-specific recombinase
MCQQAIRSEGERQSAREHIGSTIGLLALRVTENASRTGEHYITSTRTEYFEMWRLAMGGGFIVAFMSLIKLASSQANMAPLGYFMAYAINYACGFMLIHILHLTLATKQPAMTASTIAGAIGEIRGRMRHVENDVARLATLIVDLIRSQIAAILGNVLIAIPTAIIINLALSRLIGQPLMGAEKAHKLIHELSPFESLALFHAAIAGVCLFVAGLISGYYDNLAAYERIRERIEHAHWLQSLLGSTRLARFAAYMDNNLGALAGNFSLGVMLALVGTIGFLTGLPIDVRHVTLSSANFGLAFASLDFNLNAGSIMKTLLGIGLVGFVNLTVSFALALWVAMRARDVALSQTSELVAILLRRFVTAPRQFFWPAKTRVSENMKA